MRNNNQVRDILSEQEVKLFTDAVNSIGSIATMPVAACYKVLGLPELTDEFDKFFGNTIKMLMSNGYFNEEEALDKLDRMLTPPPATSSDATLLELADGYGRYKDAFKARKRRDSTERAKRHRINRGRCEHHYDDGSLQWSAGYLARKYDKAEEALDEENRPKKKKKVAPLNWSERAAYAKTMRKCRRDKVFARHYNVYSTKKQRYFVRQPKVNTESKSDVKDVSAAAEAPCYKGTEKQIKMQPIKRLSFVNSKPFAAPANLHPTAVQAKPARSGSLVNFFRGVSGHLKHNLCPFVSIRAQITGRK